jgi:hypothetical protein
MKPFQNKKIILAITPDVNIYSCIEDNLKHLGFFTQIITLTDKFKYKSIKDLIINLFRKNIIKDKQYKKELHRKFNFDSLSKKISMLTNADYSLTIRADIFDSILIKEIIKLTPNNYAYQWDGLSRFERIIELIPLFNKFYIFDKKDLFQKDKTYPTTNFYFDCYESLFQNKSPEYDIYYIGSYDNRIKKLIPICEKLFEKGYKLNIILGCSPKKELKKYPYITFAKKRLSYYENLEMVANCKCIIDLSQNTIHSGLSFRPFEALGYNKKLITTNSIIKNYDFYDDKNIFVINENCDYNYIDTFLNSIYNDIDPTIKNKYSFSNWLKYILEIEGNTPINMP